MEEDWLTDLPDHSHVDGVEIEDNSSEDLEDAPQHAIARFEFEISDTIQVCARCLVCVRWKDFALDDCVHACRGQDGATESRHPHQ